MKAIVVTKSGGPENLVLQEVPDPVLSPGDVLIDIKATALNRADLLQRRGAYPPPAGAPPYLGLECAGVVSQVDSSVAGVAVGDRVMALLGGGGYAEKVACPASHTMPVPAGMSFVQAAAVPEAFLTAREALFTLGHLAPGESVLVYGAAGGVGSAAIQLARRRGATVVGVGVTAERQEFAKSLGAHFALGRSGTDVGAELQKITAGKGIDVILDFVGGSIFDKNLDCLAVGGRLIVVGLLGGAEAKIDLGKVLRRRLQILGLVMRSRTPAEKTAIVNGFLRETLPGFTDGSLKPVVSTTLPLAQAAEAHRLLEQGKNVGKIVLSVAE